MAGYSWNPQRAAEELARLTAQGVLGFATHFEATEVFATVAGQSLPLNVFSIFVAEERLHEGSGAPQYLTPQPIRLKSLDGWSFGIKRYLKPIAELLPHFVGAGDFRNWRPSGMPLRMGELASVPMQFVPPDSVNVVPLNHVLKNNFWNGTHVLEWADPNKAELQPLFDDPPRLQELSNAVRAYVPLGLGSVSDRLGNLVVQLPITVLIAEFGQLQASGDMLVAIQWHPKATPRPLRASCELRYDGAISAIMSSPAAAPQTLLPMVDGRGMYSGAVWDDEHHILLAASEHFAFIPQVELNLRIVDPEPRVFTIRRESGGERQIKIGLTNQPIKNLVGALPPNPAGDWTNRRMYREETDRVAAELRFLQYRPEPGRQRAMHEAALGHIRQLIRLHGEQGAWLWDPYLSAEDVLNTLFHCPFSGADLRALSSGRVPLADDRAPSRREVAARPICVRLCELFGVSQAPALRQSFAEEQRAKIEGAKSNLRGLRLEYRVKTGPAGWGFHDRFLIFPTTDRGALAWSLGTSINSLGMQHHILQRVDDGQRVRDAFLDLWNTLDRPENLVWKSW